MFLKRFRIFLEGYGYNRTQKKQNMIKTVEEENKRIETAEKRAVVIYKKTKNA